MYWIGLCRAYASELFTIMSPLICPIAQSFGIKSQVTKQAKPKQCVTSLNHRSMLWLLLQVYWINTLLDQVRFYLTLYFDFQSEKSNTLGKKYPKWFREIHVGSPLLSLPQATVSMHTGLNAVSELILVFKHQDG